MATITQQFKDDDEQQKTVGGAGPAQIDAQNQQQQQGGPVTPTSGRSGTQAGPAASSGRFTNLASFMGANKQAGSQLGQILGQNVQQNIGKTTKSAQQAQTGFQGQLGKAGEDVTKLGQYMTNLGNTTGAGQAGAITNPQAQQNQQTASVSGAQQKPTGPATPGATVAEGVLSTVTGPAHLASGYQANLGQRADYASQLANDPEALAEFLRYRSGGVAGEQTEALKKAQEGAQTATTTAEQNFAKQLGNLQSTRGRDELLSGLFKGGNYSLGERQLDKAFLQMDPSDTLAQTRRAVQEQRQQFGQQNQLPALGEQSTNVQKQLGEATTGLQDQTNKNIQDLQRDIESRQAYMTQARQDQLSNLENQFKNFQTTGKLSQELAQLLGVGEGERLYNTLADVPSIGSFADISALNQMPVSSSDLANQRDVDLYSAFSRLAETNPAITQASQIGGEPVATEALSQRLREARDTARQQAISQLAGYNYVDPAGLFDDIARQNFTNEAAFRDAYRQRGAHDPELNMLANALNNIGYFNVADIEGVGDLPNIPNLPRRG